MLSIWLKVVGVPALVCRDPRNHGDPEPLVASLLLVAMPGAPSSVLALKYLFLGKLTPDLTTRTIRL